MHRAVTGLTGILAGQSSGQACTQKQVHADGVHSIQMADLPAVARVTPSLRNSTDVTPCSCSLSAAARRLRTPSSIRILCASCRYDDLCWSLSHSAQARSPALSGAHPEPTQQLYSTCHARVLTMSKHTVLHLWSILMRALMVRTGCSRRWPRGLRGPRPENCLASHTCGRQA